MKKKLKKWQIKYAPGFWESVAKCFSNRPKYAIPRWFSDKKYEIKWAWQRVIRGYDDRWYWNLDNQLQWIIPQCVRWLKKNHSGCPEKLYDKNRKGNECWEWEKILGKIAQGFEALKKIDNEYLWRGEKYKKLNKEYQEGMKLFMKYFRNLWD